MENTMTQEPIKEQQETEKPAAQDHAVITINAAGEGVMSIELKSLDQANAATNFAMWLCENAQPLMSLFENHVALMLKLQRSMIEQERSEILEPGAPRLVAPDGGFLQ